MGVEYGGIDSFLEIERWVRVCFCFRLFRFNVVIYFGYRCECGGFRSSFVSSVGRKGESDCLL